MKNALRSITLLLVVLMLAAFCMTSCDGIFDSILGTEEPPVDGGTGDGTGDGDTPIGEDLERMRPRRIGGKLKIPARSARRYVDRGRAAV